MFGGEKLCGVIAERTSAAAIARFHAARKQTRLVEIRLDYFAAKREALDFLGWLRAQGKRADLLTCIATCRSKSAGGYFRGALAEQLALLRLAVDCGCQWADVEIESARKLRRGALQKWLKPARWIVSTHNFRGLARQAEAPLRSEKADAMKIAARTENLHQALRLFSIARKNSRTIVVPMGEASLSARVLALREGSPITYGATGKSTTTGQPTLEDLSILYRAAELRRRTRVYSVIGNPILHTLSPIMHNAAFRARGADAVLLPFLVSDLRDFLDAVRPLRIAGFAVTLPHKEAILPYLDDCDPLAAKIGAVNTVVVRRGGELAGYNTDYVGVLRALQHHVSLAASRVLIFGAGGAARAVAFALAEAGSNVAICARRPEKARTLARAVAGEAIETSALRKEFFDAIVNTTPVGMYPGVEDSPLRPEELRCRVVFDAVYRPARTKLLQMAARKGLACVSGAEMFLAQGAAQWEIWMGERAPLKAMQSAVAAAVELSLFAR